MTIFARILHFFWSQTCFRDKEKVDIDGENVAQISVVTKKIVTQGSSKNYDYEVQTSYKLYLFFVFLLLWLYYVTDLIKKLELRLLVPFYFQ